MAGDDDHVVRPLGPALDGDHVADLASASGCARPVTVSQVARSRRPKRLQLALGPVERRADPALRIGLRGQRVARAEAHQLLDRPLHLRAADRQRRSAAASRPATAAPRRTSSRHGKQAKFTHRDVSSLPPRNWHLRSRGSRGAAIPEQLIQGPFSCCASIDHFIGGESYSSGEPQRRRVRPQPGRRCRRRSGSAPPPTSSARWTPPRPPSRPGPRPTRSAAPASCSSSRSWSKRTWTSSPTCSRPSMARSSPTPRATFSAGSKSSNMPAASRRR